MRWRLKRRLQNFAPSISKVPRFTSPSKKSLERAENHSKLFGNFLPTRKKANSSITNLRQAMHGQQKDVALSMATFAGA